MNEVSRPYADTFVSQANFSVNSKFPGASCLETQKRFFTSMNEASRKWFGIDFLSRDFPDLPVDFTPDASKLYIYDFVCQDQQVSFQRHAKLLNIRTGFSSVPHNCVKSDLAHMQIVHKHREPGVYIMEIDPNAHKGESFYDIWRNPDDCKDLAGLELLSLFALCHDMKCTMDRSSRHVLAGVRYINGSKDCSLSVDMITDYEHSFSIQTPSCDSSNCFCPTSRIVNYKAKMI